MLPWKQIVLLSITGCLAACTEDVIFQGPRWTTEPSDLILPINSPNRQAAVTCQAEGSPPPHYRSCVWDLAQQQEIMDAQAVESIRCSGRYVFLCARRAALSASSEQLHLSARVSGRTSAIGDNVVARTMSTAAHS
uniref:Ig-like domain-containing protein n=1 Tax=Knipowitschia caucasica TaxID=637954 RepID=A0AAV2M6E9_KNICA